MASTYLSPGVYVEEVDRGTKPIEAAGTNTLAFLGECSVAVSYTHLTLPTILLV